MSFDPGYDVDDIPQKRRTNMSQQYNNEGTVSYVSAKEWYDREKGQNIVLHSFQIEGSKRWFRLGTQEPAFRKGDFIQFVNDAKANVDPASVRLGNSRSGAPATSAPPAGATGSGRRTGGAKPAGGASQNRDGFWAEKELRDIAKDERYQSVDVPRMSFSAAQDRAVNLVSAALAHDCLSFGTTKRGDKLDYLLECVDQVTNRFFVQSMTSHELLSELNSGGSALTSGPQYDDLGTDDLED